MNQTKNVTHVSNLSNTDTEELNATTPSIVRWTFVIIACIGAVLNLLSVFVMLKTKRLHFTIKIICLNIIFYDVLFLLSEMVFQSLTISEHQTIKLKVGVICRNSVRTSWYLATFLSVERVIALEYPYLYRKYLTKRTVRLYMVFIFVVWLVYIIYRVTFDDRGAQREEWSLSCWTTNLFILICGTVVISCYSRVLVICKQQFRQVQIIGKQHTCTSKIMKSTTFFLLIAGSFILTHVPVVIESIIQRCNVNLELHSYTFSLIFLYCTLNPVIYIWRFPACRLIFLVYLKRCTKYAEIPSLQRRIVKLRIEVYDIVLPTSPGTTHLATQLSNKRSQE